MGSNNDQQDSITAETNRSAEKSSQIPRARLSSVGPSYSYVLARRSPPSRTSPENHPIKQSQSDANMVVPFSERSPTPPPSVSRSISTAKKNAYLNSTSFLTKDVIVVGAGIGGVMSALRLAKEGKKVILLEKKAAILEGSSDITPARAGLGFHYVHLQTALTYLAETIEFVKTYISEVPSLRIGEELPERHPLRRGRYFITKDTLFSKDQILSTYNQIREEYRRLCKEDSSNKVFGEPDNLFRILRPQEYENDVNMELVDCGIETAEQLLNWQNFKNYLITMVNKGKKEGSIKVLTSTPLVSAARHAETGHWNILAKNENNISFSISSPFVVNASWECVQQITFAAGILPVKPKIRTNRLKIMATVELPDCLKKVNSMFFGMGAHCMFSNKGSDLEGRAIGMLTYAPVTNFMSSEAVSVPTKMSTFLSPEDKQEDVRADMENEATQYGEKIIFGVSKYIPGMINAKLMKVGFGVVVTEGSANIYQHDSAFHQRNYSGVDSNFPLGWINNTCMKLLYGSGNAEIVAQMIKEHEKEQANLPKKAEAISKESPLENKNLINHVLIYLLQTYFTFKELSDQNSRDNSSTDIPFNKSEKIILSTLFRKAKITDGDLSTQAALLRKPGFQK